MLAALFFALATSSTFGPIAHDGHSLYVVQDGAIVRLGEGLRLTPPTSRRIAAIDVDGDRIYYATAPDVDCVPYNPVEHPSPYVGYRCGLKDAELPHEVRMASISGGHDRLLFTAKGGITEIAHDDEAVYFIEPSVDWTPFSGKLYRMSKDESFAVTEIAKGLVVDIANRHPFALTDDAIYVVNGLRVMRISKSQPNETADVTGLESHQPLFALGEALYFSSYAGFQALDTRSGTVTSLPMAPVDDPSIQFLSPISILGVGPCQIVAAAQQPAGFTGTAIRAWVVADVCSGSTRLLGSTESDKFHLWFFHPLIDPPVAVDSHGVFWGSEFLAGSPAHRRAVGH